LGKGRREPRSFSWEGSRSENKIGGKTVFIKKDLGREIRT